VELDPTFADAFILLAQVAYEQGDSQLAIRSIEKASSLRPGDRRAADLLAQWRHESSVHDAYIERPVGHFRILYEGSAQPDLGDHVGQVLEREYWRIGKALNTYPPDSLTVILYTNQEFHDITRSPAWAAGSFDGRIRVAVGGAAASRELDRVVTHEFIHAVVRGLAPRRVPAWLNEGLATLLESDQHGWTSDVLRQAGTIVPLETLVNGFSGLDEQAALIAYAESATAAEILCDQLGQNVGPFLQLVGNGNSIDQALLEFHIQPNAFHAEWRRRVGLP
jgi:hypothetical protein